MKNNFDSSKHPHRRYNPLLNEWILVSPQRANRPWQGQTEKISVEEMPSHDPKCYLCSGSVRVNGDQNPTYKGTFVFDNDFGTLLNQEVEFQTEPSDLFKIQPERGINKVVCFSDNHGLTLPEMSLEEIKAVVDLWQKEYTEIGKLDYINHIQIFENKGSVMGCSNPHPHGQIWAQSSIPTSVSKTQNNLLNYYNKHGKSLLEDYVVQELEKAERVVVENNHFVALVPYWAIWPYEIMIISKRKIQSLVDFTEEEKIAYAEILKLVTIKLDNLFQISFPYSAGIHQAPTDGEDHAEWHFHMHFYPPLLRSATIKKFMVGYEMLAESQRDITPEQAAKILQDLPLTHYKSAL